jgi:hypothetical protein
MVHEKKIHLTMPNFYVVRPECQSYPNTVESVSLPLKPVERTKVEAAAEI